MIKPRVLLFSRWFAPGYKGGGSLFAVLNLVRALQDDFDFYVVTTNHDYGEADSYPSIAQGDWTPFENIRVRYLTDEELSYAKIHKIVESTSHDLLHLNSTLSPYFFLFPLLSERRCVHRVPTLVTPHGELSRGALKQKPWRKKIYLHSARLVRLFREVRWQALSQHEEEDIRREICKSADVSIVPAISNIRSTAPDLSPLKLPNQLRVVFLSRIDRLKNLDLVINLIGKVPGTTLDIYGPIGQSDYWMECQKLLDKNPRRQAIRYCGSLPPGDVSPTLAGYDLFFLPSKGENFGYVLLEALAAGCPVLTSDLTPWKGLSALGVGADFPLERPDIFEAFLKSAVFWTEEELELKRFRARNYARQFLENSEAISLTRLLYHSLLRNSTAK